MSTAFENNKTILQRILPSGYDYNVVGASFIENGESPTEVKLNAKFRVNVHDEEQIEKFLVDFSESSGTAYNKKRTVQIGLERRLHYMDTENVFIMFRI